MTLQNSSLLSSLWLSAFYQDGYTLLKLLLSFFYLPISAKTHRLSTSIFIHSSLLKKSAISIFLSVLPFLNFISSLSLFVPFASSFFLFCFSWKRNVAIP